MLGVEDSRNKDFCFQLLYADTEEKIIEILKRWQYWDAANWKAYGDVQNNRGIVSNQQSSPVAALVEKIVNSIDAVLTAECLNAGIQPAGANAPKTMQGAVEQFFGVKDGRIENLTATQRTELAQMIVLIATGQKESPNYVLIDRGEGQSPDHFKDTFLSLLRDNKTRIPFVQGKYNMGGTGVLQFSGRHSFQLIISKRKINLENKEAESSDKWGFTLTRRLEPNSDQPQSSYVFLAPGSRILSFASDALDILPGKYPNAHEEPLEAGTCIKMWNYKLPGRLKTLATLDLRWALERYLQNPALPIRISERRLGYRANYYDTTMSGMLTVIADNPQDIEIGFDTGSPLELPGLGCIELRLIVLKDTADRDNKKYATGIFFNVNGQLHGELGKDFISKKTNLDYVADSMIVIIDCSKLPTIVREDLFMGSRDRMRQCDERHAIEEAIGEYLRDHPGLKQLNALRRQNRTEAAISDEKTAEIFQALVRGDPTLGALFGKGEKIKLPTGSIPDPVPYEGVRYPTKFRLLHEPQGGLVKACPKNKTCRVEFETDASNDYFSRALERGYFKVIGLVAPLSSVHLWNGRASVRFAPPPGASSGDRYVIRTEVSDASRVEPFRSEFAMVIESDSITVSPSSSTSTPGSKLTEIPNVIGVSREKWNIYKFNEFSALEIKRGTDEQLDFFVNVDNLYLRNEIARRKSTEKDLLQYYFKYGLSLLALGILHIKQESFQELNGENNISSEDIEWPPDDVRQEVAEACQGAAVTIVPIIIQLGKIPARIDT